MSLFFVSKTPTLTALKSLPYVLQTLVAAATSLTYSGIISHAATGLSPTSWLVVYGTLSILG